MQNDSALFIPTSWRRSLINKICSQIEITGSLITLFIILISINTKSWFASLFIYKFQSEHIIIQ